EFQLKSGFVPSHCTRPCLSPSLTTANIVPASETDRRPPLVVTEHVPQMRGIVRSAQERGLRVGLVPTMGALHAGHLSLIQAARTECEFVVVSIFVNPTQFGPTEDFQRYPRNLHADLKLCGDAGADVVFHPAVDTIYPRDYATFVDVTGLSEVLEGKFR